MGSTEVSLGWQGEYILLEYYIYLNWKMSLLCKTSMSSSQLKKISLEKISLSTAEDGKRIDTTAEMPAEPNS